MVDGAVLVECTLIHQAVYSGRNDCFRCLDSQWLSAQVSTQVLNMNNVEDYLPIKSLMDFVSILYHTGYTRYIQPPILVRISKSNFCQTWQKFPNPFLPVVA